MVLSIERDQNRFKQIVRGAIRRNLKKYITRGEFIGRRGKDFVSIPVPQVEIPTFRYDPRSTGGVGQGEGEAGTPIGAAPGEGAQGAGDMPGEHLLEVDVQLDELAKILGEELELPRIEARGKKNIIQEENRYIGINRVGPESLRHFKRTYKEALKRQIASGTYSPERPVIVPIRQDLRYRARKKVPGPTANAVIIYMMDVSGSMEDEQKEIVRIESFWIDAWLRSQYRGIESRYIRANMFCYGQVEGRYGSGKFLDMLADRFESADNLALSRIESREHIFNSIKAFLGKGR